MRDHVQPKPPHDKDVSRIRHNGDVNSVFISDVHLGFSGCSAEYLCDFLDKVRCKNLYLVGDIIDVWSMRKTFYWPQAHNDVIRAILAKARNGTRVIYIPGNHDEIFRDYVGEVFGRLEIHRDYVHTTADGRRLLILHGDEFDSVVKCSPWLARLGSLAYGWLIRANRYLNSVRRHFGFPYWSLANYLKHRVKNAVNYISSFENAVLVSAAAGTTLAGDSDNDTFRFAPQTTTSFSVAGNDPAAGLPAGIYEVRVRQLDLENLAAFCLPFGFQPPGGGDGCTPGYWKQSHHFDSWPAAYSPNGTTFGEVFTDCGAGDTLNRPESGSICDKTLLQALELRGGGLNALGRHAVAALLSASTVSYDLTPGQVVSAVNDALSSNSYSSTKNMLADYNEQNCPLN